MKADLRRSVADLEAEIGRHLRARRIEEGLRQADLADLANVSVSTLSNLESGKGGNLTTFVKVLRALGATRWIDDLAPTPEFSPLALLDPGGRRARRATDKNPRARARRTEGS